MRVSARSFTTFSVSTPNGTCLMSFLEEAGREMIAEFNASLKTPFADLPTEFVPPTDHSHEVVDRPPQVINEDSPAVTAGGGGGANEDDG